jgi:hypothetical protein
MRLPDLTPVEEHIAFHMAIGQAVTQWAHVENGLFNICTVAFGKASVIVVGASFHAIENFRTKLAFTDNAVTQSVEFAQILPDWIKIRDQVQGLSSTRNKIAHCRTIGYPAAPVGRRYAIVPISYKEQKIKSKKAVPPNGSLCVKDIDLAAHQFSIASNRLMDVMARGQGGRWPPAEHGRQEAQVRSLIEIRSLIDTVRLQRP